MPIVLPSEDYIVRPIRSLRILDARTEPKADDRDIRTVHPGDVDADIVVSGTFHSGARGTPLGPLIQGGRYTTAGGFNHGRGGVALLADGSVQIGFYPDVREAAVRAVFEGPGNAIVEFMGGGALIIESGQAVSWDDLRDRQGFRSPPNTGPFERNARHVIIAVDGVRQAYLVLDIGSKSLESMQRELIAAGVRDAIMFDGGNAFGFEDRGGLLFGRLPGRQPPALSAREIAALRGRRDVALTGLAIEEGERGS